jgi:hypothetical protein
MSVAAHSPPSYKVPKTNCERCEVHRHGLPMNLICAGGGIGFSWFCICGGWKIGWKSYGIALPVLN